MIPQETINEILEAATIEDVAEDLFTLKKSGKSFYCTCPQCGKTGKGKGLIITPAKQIYKCFSCGYSGKSPVNLVMEQKKYTYPEALEWLAGKYGIVIPQNTAAKGPQKRKSSKNKETFCDRQLKGSGLTKQDVTARVYVDENTEKLVETFQSGTRNQYFKIVPGDDMIIWYYNLEGKPVTFKKPRTNRFEHLFRVRWQIPENHPDRNGRSIKYQSPSGSGSHLYIPQIIRQAYKDLRVLKRLYIQEGEKKAEKACKHGMPSVGIMGIHNIASQGHLPNDLQLIVQACQVEEVVFTLDSDWDQLSENLKPGERIDLRTASFFKAVRNFRDYFKAFSNHGIYLELYFARVKQNNNNDKGIDDLLVNTLKDRENELFKDFNEAINNIREKNGEGKYIQVNKITTLTDIQIMQLWEFDNTKNFLKKHKDTLLIYFPNGEIFKIGKLEWRYNQEKKDFEPAQPLTLDEQYWEEIVWEDARGNEKKKLQFDYVNLKKFLRNRGFGRLKMANGKYVFSQCKNKVIRNIEAGEIKDFVVEFTEEVAAKDVQNMILRGGRMYLGPDSLSNMYKMEPVFETPQPDSMQIYFADKYWKITEKEIEEKPLNQLQNSIWDDKIINFKANKTSEPLLKAEMFTEADLEDLPAKERKVWKHFVGQFDIEFTETGKKCHFLQFLNNTGEFAWRKMIDPKTRQKLEDTRTIDEKFETNQHLMSKLTAIGYLLHDYINNSMAKAIICMDGKMSEVGQSNGRTGKSILGTYIGKIVPQVYVGYKQKKLTEDPFLFEGVNEKTKSVFFDDVRANIDIEFFYPYITGLFSVRPLGEKKFTLPEDMKPKLIFTTNHGVNDAGGSLRDRIFMLAFSDYYNENHKPIDDFGINFFQEWDNEQWNLAYNLAALSLQLYFKYGLVKAPLHRLELRNLRQEMGEAFLEWADEYYSDPTNLGHRIPRSEISDNFLSKVPTAKRYYTPHNFKKKLKAYAKFRGFIFNPDLFDKDGNPKKHDSKGRPIDYDKAGGVEYITLSEE